MASDIPERLLKAAQACGPAGAQWVAHLPEQVRQLARRWGITVGEPFSGSHVSYTAPVSLSDGRPAVLKVPMKDVVLATAAARARQSEPAALRLWDGDGAVRLFEFDSPSGAMLLERCLPGDALGNLNDLDARDEIGAELLLRLWHPARPDTEFVRLADVGAQMMAWSVDRYETFAQPFDDALFEATLDAWQTVRMDPARCVVLHGDFHSDNILAASREPWLAADPLPMIGDPAYDAVQFLLFRKGDTPDPGSEWGAAVCRFCDLLGLDMTRVLAWTLVRLVSDALAEISQGTVVGRLEEVQGDLWSARLVRNLLG